MTRSEARREIERMRQDIAPSVNPLPPPWTALDRARIILDLLLERPECCPQAIDAATVQAALDNATEGERATIALEFLTLCRQHNIEPSDEIGFIVIPDDGRNPDTQGIHGCVVVCSTEGRSRPANIAQQ